VDIRRFTSLVDHRRSNARKGCKVQENFRALYRESAIKLVSQSRIVGMKLDLADVYDCRSIVKLALQADAHGSKRNGAC
jgi:hypothetical protein